MAVIGILTLVSWNLRMYETTNMKNLRSNWLSNENNIGSLRAERLVISWTYWKVIFLNRKYVVNEYNWLRNPLDLDETLKLYAAISKLRNATWTCISSNTTRQLSCFDKSTSEQREMETFWRLHSKVDVRKTKPRILNKNLKLYRSTLEHQVIT